MWDHTPVELFLKGGFAMWPLLFCSGVGLAIMLERSLVFWWYRAPLHGLVAGVKPLILAERFAEADKLVRRLRSPLARVVEAFLENMNCEPELRLEIVDRECSAQLTILETRLSWLGIISQLAPMLGLLGTVTGLVSAFHAIEVAGGSVQPADLAAGIWEALITTVFALVIALPCAAAFHLLDRRLATLALHMEWMKTNMKEWLQKSDQREDVKLIEARV